MDFAVLRACFIKLVGAVRGFAEQYELRVTDKFHQRVIVLGGTA
jgi:hypothetical protein